MPPGQTQAGGGGGKAPEDEGEFMLRGDVRILFEEGVCQIPEPEPPIKASEAGGSPTPVHFYDTGDKLVPDEGLAPASEDNSNQQKIDKLPTANKLGWYANIKHDG